MIPTSAVHPWACSNIYLGNFYFYLPQNKKVRRPSIYAVTKAEDRGKCSQLLGSFAFTRGNLPGYFLTIHKESHSWRMRAREVAWTQSGIRTERRRTRRHRVLKTHWGGGAGLSATKLGVVRPWELITSSTPTPPRLFLPLSCQPSKRNELTPPFWDFPSFTQTTQTDASQTCQLVWVAGRGTAGSSSGLFGKVHWFRARSQGRASLQRPQTVDLIKFILAIIQSGLQR